MVERLVRQLSGGVEKLASLPPGRSMGMALVDTGPMPQVRRTQRAETIGAVLRSIVADADLVDRRAHGARASSE